MKLTLERLEDRLCASAAIVHDHLRFMAMPAIADFRATEKVITVVLTDHRRWITETFSRATGEYLRSRVFTPGVTHLPGNTQGLFLRDLAIDTNPNDRVWAHLHLNSNKVLGLRWSFLGGSNPPIQSINTDFYVPRTSG